MDGLRKVIAIDFDGCLCENKWPEIGEPYIGVFAAAIEEQKKGTAIILNTCRFGDLLKQAVDFCAENGLVFDAVNENLQERIDAYGGDCRKISADEYWDDKAVQFFKGRSLSDIKDVFEVVKRWWKKGDYPDDECDRLENIKQEENVMKVVSIRHANNGRQFLFEVPDGWSVKKGQTVMCETKNGTNEGAAECDSFEVSESALSSLVDVFGAKLPLKKIVGEYRYIDWTEGSNDGSVR